MQMTGNNLKFFGLAIVLICGLLFGNSAALAVTSMGDGYLQLSTGTVPAGVNGTLFYNSGTNKFRCYEGGAWRDCLTATTDMTNWNTAFGWGDHSLAGYALSGANADITSLSGLTTALSEAQGGTGQSTYATGDILYASAANTLSKLPIGGTDQILTVSAGGVPTWTNSLPLAITTVDVVADIAARDALTVQEGDVAIVLDEDPGALVVPNTYIYDGSAWQEIKKPLNQYLAVANNLSDLSNNATARTNLGVAIGSDVQAWSPRLDDIAGLAVTDGNIIVGDGSNWVAESGGTARTSLGAAASGANTDITSLIPGTALTITAGASSTWSVAGAGNDLTIDAADVLNVGNTNATSLVLGNAANTTSTTIYTDALTVSTDGTGNTEVVLPQDSISSLEILDGDLLEVDLKAVDAPADEECLTYESTGGDFEWQACGSSSKLNSITAADGTNTIDSLNFAQTWNWSTASTENPFTMTGNALTSGELLTLSSSSTGLTGSVLDIQVTGNNAGVTGKGLNINVSGASSVANALYVTNAGTGTAAYIENTGTGVSFRVDDSAAADTTPFIIAADGKTGIGLTTPAVRLHVTDTAEQLRLAYDGSNYASFTVAADGELTIAPTGTDAGLTLDPQNQTVTADGNVVPSTTATYDLGTTNLRWKKAYVGGNSLHIGVDGDEATIGYDLTDNQLLLSSANGLNIAPTTVPGTPAAGDLYYDSGTNLLRWHNGTTWVTGGSNFAINGSFLEPTTNTLGIRTTNSQPITSDGTLTASNGFTMTTGALSLTATSGTINLSGLTSTSIVNTGAMTLTAGATSTWSTTAGDLTINSGTTTSAALNLGTAGSNAINIGQAGVTTTNNGPLTVAQLLTGQLGLTVSGAAISLNNNSNFTTDINTGSSTGAINIGSGTGAKTITIGNTQAATALVLDAGATNGITITSNTTLNAQSDMRFADADSSNWAAIQAPTAIVSNFTLTLPTDDGTLNQVLTTDGNGVLSWSSAGSGDITAVGSMTSGDAFADATADDDWLGLGATAGRIEFDDQTTDEVNILSSYVGIGTSTPTAVLEITPTIADALRINPYGTNAGNTGSLELMELAANGSDYVAFKSPDALTASNTYTLPTAYPAESGYVLTSDTGGVLSWSSGRNAAGIYTTYKPTTESVANSETLQNDDHLYYPIGSSEVWTATFYIYVTSATNRDIKVAISAPVGATCIYTASAFSVNQSKSIATCGSEIYLDASNVPAPGEMMVITSTVINSTTSGTVYLQWAQNTAGGSTTVAAGSYFHAMKE